MSNLKLGVLPGMGTEQSDVDSGPFIKNTQGQVFLGLHIQKDSEDAGNVGKETTLRKGVLLIRIETGADAGKYAPADHGDVPASNAIVQAAILGEDVDMLGSDGTTVATRNVSAVIGGVIDEDKLIIVDAGYRDGAVAALPLCHFIAAP